MRLFKRFLKGREHLKTLKWFSSRAIFYMSSYVPSSFLKVYKIFEPVVYICSQSRLCEAMNTPNKNIVLENRMPTTAILYTLVFCGICAYILNSLRPLTNRNEVKGEAFGTSTVQLQIINCIFKLWPPNSQHGNPSTSTCIWGGNY